jgi:uncharacterized protein DUF1579
MLPVERKHMSLRFVPGFVLMGGLHFILAAAPASPEWKVLEKFKGSWKGEVKVTAGDGKETTFSTKNSFTPVLDGRFMEDKGGAVDGSSAQVGMWRYDPVGKKYQSWYFLAPGGEAVQFTYDWFEAEQTIRGTADLGGGMTMEAVDQFKGKNAYEWTIIVKGKDGTVYNTMVGKQTRVR